MQIYLNSLVEQLKNYSVSLDKTSILIDKPWTLIDDEQEMQKLIFKKNKELVMSKNGQVQIGKWDYYPEAKALLIDRNTDKILCNEAFIDKGVMVLRLDGTLNKFFTFANENVIPDLDAYRYLNEVRFRNLNISTIRLADGKLLEVQRGKKDKFLAIGNLVTIEAEQIPNGKYQIENKNQANNVKFYQVRQGRISNVLTERKYINPDGIEILIHQQNSSTIKYGDDVFIFGQEFGTGIINFSKHKNLLVKNGYVVGFEYKNKVLRWFGINWVIFFSFFSIIIILLSSQAMRNFYKTIFHNL